MTKTSYYYLLSSWSDHFQRPKPVSGALKKGTKSAKSCACQWYGENLALTVHEPLFIMSKCNLLNFGGFLPHSL